MTEQEGEQIKEKKPINLIPNIIYYAMLLIVGVYLKQTQSVLQITVGDSGTVVKILFAGISNVSIRWMPLMGFVGLILITRAEELRDMLGVYRVATIIIAITGIVLRVVI